MSEILEASMLICFGLSWPISLIKNIKAHSAKNMSLKFNMLIILGYLAGITAKFMNGAFNYVLIVYLLNLLIVCANVVIYFINKSYDIAKNQKPFPAFQGSGFRLILSERSAPFQSGLAAYTIAKALKIIVTTIVQLLHQKSSSGESSRSHIRTNLNA